MQSVTVIDKATMDKIDINSNIIKLEKGSIIQTKLHREDIAEITQDGNNLIIKLKNGETITIENYFSVDAEGNNTELVFEGTECAFLQLVWDNGIAGFKELAGLEELLPIAAGGGSATSNLLPWIIGGGVIGGIGAAAGGSGGSSHKGNNIPEAKSEPKTTPEDQPVSGKVTGTDVDGDDLTYVVAEPPKNGTVTIDPDTGDYTYTPNPDFNGDDSFTITVDDGKGGKVDVPVNITVTPVNDAPVAGEDDKITPEDQPVSGKVPVTDVDGDDLTYVVAEPPKNGTVTIDPDTGDYTYTPNPDFNGDDSFTITVDDGKGGKVDVPVNITVTPVNDAPVAGEDDKITPEDQPVSGKVPVTDVDGDDLTYVVAEPPKNGTVTIDPDTGDYTYTPNPDFNGDDSFTITVDDGKGGKVDVPVNITVTPVNDAPVAGEDDKITPEDQPVSGKVPVTDVDGDDLTYVVAEPPKNGTVTIDPDTGDYTYMPNPDFNGDDSFTITVDDGKGGKVDVPVNITVTPVNDAPVAGEDDKITPEDQPVSGKVPVTDVDGDDLTYVVAEPPKNGTVTIDPDTGDYTYTPNPDFNGDDSFTITVDDGKGGKVNVPVNITVTPVNDAPVAGEDDKITPEDQPVSGKVPVTDVDGDDLTYVVAEPPKNGTVTIDPDTGDYTYTPNPDFNGDDSFTITVDDGKGGKVDVPVNITVTPVNDAPVAGEDDKITPEDQPVSGKVPVTDVDGDDLTYVVAEPPKNGTVTIDPGTGDYTYTPNPDFNGDDSFTITVDDGKGGKVDVPVNITVTPVNDAPVAGEDDKITPEDQPVSGKVPVTDVDGDDLTYVVAEPPKNGTVTIDPDTGDYTYTPNPDFNGDDSFTITVDDGKGGKVDVPVNITVTPVNDAPVAGEDDKITPEDQPVSGKVPVTDVDGDDLTYVVAEPPKNGTVTIDPDTGDYTYTPNPDFNGDDSFTITVDDGKGGKVDVPVNITVTPVNDAPVAGEDDKITPEDQPVSGKVPVTDVDGDNLTYTLGEPPKNGEVTINPDGSYTYTPDPNFNGEDSFIVTVDDGKGGKVDVPVNITVTPVQDLTGQDDTATVKEDEVLDGTVATNDSTTSGGTLVYEKASDPTNGTLIFNADGTYTYTPNANFNGTDSFTYTVKDPASGEESTQTVTITVDPVQDLTGQDDTATVKEDEVLDGTVATNDSTTSGGKLVYEKASDPANGTLTFNADGTYTYTPNANFNGTDSFTYTVKDPASGEESTQTVTITVDPVQDLTGQDDTATVKEDEVLDGTVATNDSTTSGGKLVYEKASDPTNGTLIFNADGTYTYTPNANFNGTDSFTYTVKDPASGEESTQTVTITVDPVQDLTGQDDTATVKEDEVLDGTVATNDSTTSGGKLVYEKASDPTNGTLIFNADGTYTYTPNENFNGTDSFTYTVKDPASGEESTQTVTITVDPVQDLTGQDDTATVKEDEVLDGTVATNDSTTSGGKLVYEKASDPTNGTLIFNADGTYTYTPNENFNGTDSFTYTVKDPASGEESTQTVTITVDPVNDDPVAGKDDKITPEDQPVSGKVPVTDVDGDKLTYTLGEPPKNGEVTINPDGSYTYTPDPNFNGEDSFIVTVDDGNGGVVEVPIKVTVTPVQDLTGQDDTATVKEDEVLDGTVATNDSTTSGGKLVYEKASDPTNGTLIFNADGTYTYTPNANFNGTDSFTYTVKDPASGEESTQTVTITVDPVQDLTGQEDTARVIDY